MHKYMNKMTIKTVVIPYMAREGWTPQKITHIINKSKIAVVKNVNMVKKIGFKGDDYYCVYIYIQHWLQTDIAMHCLRRLENGQDIKIAYDGLTSPHLWKLFAYQERVKK